MDFDRRRDALDETREDAARPDLDRPGDAQGRDGPNRLLPTDRARDLPREQLGDPRRVRVGRGLDVGDDGDLGRLEGHLGELAREAIGRGLHEPAVERRAHGQQLRELRAARLRAGARAFDRAPVARDDDLSTAVEVGGAHDLALRGLGAGGHHGLGVEAHDGRHGAHAGRHGLLHEAAPQVNERDGVRQGERARRDERRVLAERVTGHGRGP